MQFDAQTGDFELLGVISDNAGRMSFTSQAGRSITRGAANTFSGDVSIGSVTVEARVLADAGLAGSLGTGASTTISNGALTYTGTCSQISSLTLGGSFAGVNTLSGVMWVDGSLRSTGSGTRGIVRANTLTGELIVHGGTLRAGSASAFGTTRALR